MEGVTLSISNGGGSLRDVIFQVIRLNNCLWNDVEKFLSSTIFRQSPAMARIAYVGSIFDCDHIMRLNKRLVKGFFKKCQITPKKRGWMRDSHNPQRGSSIQRMGFGQEGTQDWPANRSICAFLQG
ncbi:hypothetical protein ACFX12_027946 [Malus domestica]